MDDVGFKSWTEDGRPQVGNRDIVWALSQASTMTLYDDGMTHPQPLVHGTLTVTANAPVLAIRPVKNSGGLTTPISMLYSSKNGNQFSFYFIAQSGFPVTFDWWLFDNADSAMLDHSMDNVGGRVYNIYGQKTFDASMHMLRPVGWFAPSGDGIEAITEPSGKTYAVVFTGMAHHASATDTGEYSDSDTKPPMIVDGGQLPGDGPIGGGHAKWRHQNIWTASASVDAAGKTLFMGMMPFEEYSDWFVMNSEPYDNYTGQMGFSVVDVTGFPGGGGTTPGGFEVYVNSTVSEVNISNAGDSVTPAVTLSIVGASGTPTIEWLKRPGGTPQVVANGATNQTSFNTKVVGQPAGTSYAAFWYAKVTVNGVTSYSPDVLFKHTTGSVDTTPDNITLPTMDVSSTEHDVFWDTLSYGTYTITGINQPITLRFERYDYSGNMASLFVDVYTKAPGGSWVHHGYYSAHSSGPRYIDVSNVVNGTEVRYRVHGITDSGRRTATCRFSLWALESNVQFGQSAMCNFVVDSDDNYNNADYDPDLVNWSSVNGSTGDASFFQSTNTQTISGINRNIEIRATISNFSGTNVAASSRLETYVNGAYKHDSSGLGNGYWTHAPSVGNGTNIAYVMHLVAANQSQAATATYTVTVTNVNTGQTIDTFTVNQSVNSADIDPNPISVPALTLTTDEPSGWTNTAELTISGINRPIVLRFTRGNQWDWGGIFTRRLYIYHSNNAGASWTEYFVGAGAVSKADITVNNGDWIHIRAYMDTNTGRGETSFTGYITNLTSGETLLASYSVSGVVDANNDYNIGDYTPDPMSWPDVTWSTTNNVVYGAYSAIGPQITGINRSVQLQFKVISASSNTTWQNLEITNHSHNTHGTITNYTTNSSVNITVANGDTFICKVSCGSDSGIRNTSATVQVINLSDGNRVIGTFNINVTVDADNNYNIGDYSMNPMDFSNIWFDTPDNSYYTYNNYQTVSGINRPVTVSVQIANFNVSGPIQNSLFACQSQRGDLMTTNLLNGTSYMTVQNGDNIRFAVVVGTTGGRRSFSFDVYITNQDTGEFIDHHHVSGFFGSNPLTVDVNTPFVSNYFFANAGVNFQSYTNHGDVVLTVNGGVGNKTIVWEQYGSSWGSIWSYSGTTQPIFQYFGKTNYSAETMARAKVTDQAGNVAYSGWVTINLAAGNDIG